MLNIKRLFKRNKRSGLTGLSFTNDGVGIARVDWRNNQPIVAAFDYISTDSDGDSLADAVSRYDLDQSSCSVLLNTSEYKLLRVDAPNVPDTEMVDAVRWRIRDLIDYPVEDAAIDVFDTPSVAAGAAAASVYAVVSKKQSVTSHVDSIQRASLDVDIVDIPEMAVRNLADQMYKDGEAVLTLAFYRSSGLLSISKSGQVYLSRVLDLGYESLTGDDGIQFALEQVVLELQRSMDYYESHYRMAAIRNVAIIGMPVDESVLLAYIESNIGLSAKVIVPEDFLLADAGIDLSLSRKHPACTLALGAALRSQEAAA